MTDDRIERNRMLRRMILAERLGDHETALHLGQLLYEMDQPPYCTRCGIPHTRPCLRDLKDDHAT